MWYLEYYQLEKIFQLELFEVMKESVNYGKQNLFDNDIFPKLKRKK
ncbi:unnamed protein product [Paramecium sonneborni]|uniref:Uncharacterized protein n=1 Tax=Paramecium sonneborni TaxID=65129 RepID=A0A8S1PM59_9CILI|nr:unnamed protein product [Paramecium sonneborni]